MPDTASVLKIETLSPLAEKIIIDRSNFSDIYVWQNHTSNLDRFILFFLNSTRHSNEIINEIFNCN